MENEMANDKENAGVAAAAAESSAAEPSPERGAAQDTFECNWCILAGRSVEDSTYTFDFYGGQEVGTLADICVNCIDGARP